jgi:hypothetical protein
MKIILTAIVLFGASLQPIMAQHSLNELEPSEYFDFWIGEWELTWEASEGSIETGTNTIEYVLDGNVIKENFEAITGQMAGYVGKSYSV